MQIQTLALTQLEELGEALLDFSELADLLAWLQTSQQEAIANLLIILLAKVMWRQLTALNK